MVKFEYVHGDLWLNGRGDVCRIIWEPNEKRFCYEIVDENKGTRLPKLHSCGRFGLCMTCDGDVSTRDPYWVDYRLVDRVYQECPY
jgi:hypothetical protein